MTNAERAARAQKAMIAYVGSDQYSAEDHLPDLICDLLHYARQSDVEIDSVIRSAMSNYVAECVNPDDSFSLRISTTIDFV